MDLETTELDQIRATMIVNYSDIGRTEKGLVSLEDSTLSMVIKVLQFYTNTYENSNKNGKINESMDY